MEAAPAIILFIVVTFVVIVAAAKRSQQRNTSWRRLAEAYGGRLKKGSLFQRPSVSFERHGQDVLVDVYSTGGKDATNYTQVHLHWPDNLRLEVYPKGFFARIGLLLGMQDVKLGSSHFDEHFIVRGSDEEEIRRLLAADVQQSIIQLRDSWHVRDVYVRFFSATLLVKKRGYANSYRQLSQLTELALELHERALATMEGGMDFEGDVALLKLEEAVCQICGSDLGPDVVFCRRCKTPHHRDCWSYYGACSTYGCGETSHVNHTLRLPRRHKVHA